MKELVLSQGKVAIVDDDIFDSLGRWKWSAQNPRGVRWYAYRKVEMCGRKRKSVFLHQAICGMPLSRKIVIDHINGDGLDNRRDNLRFLSQGENISNSHLRRCGKTHSRFPGVTWHKGKKRWYTSFTKDGVTKFIGTFRKETDAAIARQKYLVSGVNQNG